MFQDDEDLLYYINLYNDPYPMPAMPEGVEDGILNGLYKFRPGPDGLKHKAHLFGSGPIIQSALQAQKILAEHYQVSADVWSATSYQRLRSEALNCQRWNMLHPGESPKRSYLESILDQEQGVFVAVSDQMKSVADQIAPCLPGGLMTLGTDGFGRSDTREALRDHFEVDHRWITYATVYGLYLDDVVDLDFVKQVRDDLKIDVDKIPPATA